MMPLPKKEVPVRIDVPAHIKLTTDVDEDNTLHLHILANVPWQLNINDEHTYGQPGHHHLTVPNDGQTISITPL